MNKIEKMGLLGFIFTWGFIVKEFANFTLMGIIFSTLFLLMFALFFIFGDG